MHYAVFGGSFNPPHCGHAMVVLWALMTGKYDAVIVIPTFRHEFGKVLGDFEQRMYMTRLALEHVIPDRVIVSDIERKIGHSVTADTLEALHEMYPGSTFDTLVGSDLVPTLDRWKGIDRLRSLSGIRVINRELYAGGVSSTSVREAIMRDDKDFLRDTVPQPVLEFIEKMGLYRA